MRSKLATLLGVLTTLTSALVLIDFDAFRITSVNDWIKLLVVLLPAIGGYVSEIKPIGNETPPNNN